jgi:Capsular polysaccharide synthesis protein/Protein of unknown function (DUF3431)
MRMHVVLSAVAAAACVVFVFSFQRQTPTFDVVLSHYKEEPRLAQRTVLAAQRLPLEPRRTLVYTKGGSDVLIRGAAVIHQSNQGREGATYLRYLLDNYYDLPDYVVFTQADPNDRRGFERKLRSFRGADVHDLGYASSTDKCSCTGCFAPNNVTMSRIAPLYSLAVGAPCADGFVAFFNGQFIVSKRAIYRQSYRFYQFLYGLLLAPASHWVHRDQLAVASQWNFSADDGMFGHVLERSWPFIFGCLEPISSGGWVCDRVGPPSTVFQARQVPAKTVWLLWLSGWDTAPWVAQRVAAGWAALNPGWNIELISDATVRFYLPDMLEAEGATPQARSDLIRLHLLAEYGGVWADATLACMQPLDLWVEPALRPSGFWAYHGTVWPPPAVITSNTTLYPASWFLVARPGNALVVAWRDAADAFWRAPPPAVDYFWMDALLRQLLASDESVAAVWRRAPYVSCEDEYSAHWLSKKGRMLAPLSAADAERLEARPPYAMKLTHKGGVPRRGPFKAPFKRSAMWYVLESRNSTGVRAGTLAGGRRQTWS